VSSLNFDPVIFGESVETGLPVVILAVDFQGSSTVLLYSDSDGYLHTGEPKDLRTDWRWELKRGWYDATAPGEGEPDG
jgi:hypothetical protein